MASTTGLEISPIRQELKVDPGGTTTGNLVVANLTKQNLDITMFFRAFSVIDSDYDYTFEISQYDWIRISQPELTLKPGESRTIPYTFSPGATASPGGYYFTLFASSNLQTNGINSTIQAASLLYATVNGKLDKSTELNSTSIPSVIFSPNITYNFRTTDTGNVYYTIYSIARLSNIFTSSEGDTAAHLIIPGKPRDLNGSIPAPSLPGIYTATIGYRTDSGNIMTVSKPVLYMPLWGIVVTIGLAFIAYRVTVILRRKHRRGKFRR